MKNKLFRIAAFLLFVSACVFSVQSCKTSEDSPEDASSNSETNTASEKSTYGKNTSNQTSSLGTNLAVFSNNSPEWGFVDAFVKSSAWIPNLCNASTTDVTTDANGWVTELGSGDCASSFIFNQMSGHYPSGEYVILWEGDGSFIVEQDGNLLFSHTQGSGAAKRATFNVAPTTSQDGIYFSISSVGCGSSKKCKNLAAGRSLWQKQDSVESLRLLSKQSRRNRNLQY